LNYLSHFYIDQKPGNHYYNVGLFLPDFARNHVTSFSKSALFDKEEHSQIHAGCMAHYAADKKFHSSDFFEHYNESFRNHLKAAPFSDSFQRRWFLAHILFEMMIDRLLVKHINGLCKNYYHSLDKIEPIVLGEFLQLNQAKNPDELLRNFNHFRNAKYIFQYIDNNTLVYSLSRVLQYVGVSVMSIEDKLVLRQCIIELEESIFKNALQIITEVKSIF
jgi:hypothetical protein